MSVRLSVEVIREGETRLMTYMEIRAAFKQLPDVEKVVLGLVAEGYTYQEIGDIIGVTKSAVGDRKRKAIAYMRMNMKLSNEEVHPTSRNSEIRTCGIGGCQFTGNGWQVGAHKQYNHFGRNIR